MLKIYTHENSLIVENVKNILKIEGIDSVLKNEFASGALGELAPIDTWPELWLENDSDANAATAIIEELSSSATGPDWTCTKCNEENQASFQVCWNCQTENA